MAFEWAPAALNVFFVDFCSKHCVDACNRVSEFMGGARWYNLPPARKQISMRGMPLFEFVVQCVSKNVFFWTEVFQSYFQIYLDFFCV